VLVSLSVVASWEVEASFGRARLPWEGEAPAEPADVIWLVCVSPWRETMAAE
jgi:hypothetical protein